MPKPDRNFHLLDAFKVIQQRRRVVLTTFAVVFALVLLGTFAVTPQYQGTAKVLIERGESADLSGRGRGSVAEAEFYQTQYQLIKSRAVARRVVEILGLSENYAEQTAGHAPLRRVAAAFSSALQALKALFSSGTTSPEPAGPSWQDQAAVAISDEIRVAPVSESRLVTISYSSPDPVFAAKVANTTAQAYIEQTLTMKVDASHRNQEWMNQKAQAERDKLEKAEQALQAYVQANDIVTLDNRVTVTPERLAELSTQLTRAEMRRQELEALYHQVSRVVDQPQSAETVTAIASDPTLQSLRTQIVDTEKQAMELSNKYGPKHPVMIKVNGDLAVLQQKRQQEIRRVAQTIRNDYELALANERSLRSQLSLSKSETLQLNERFIRYGALKREVDTLRQTYDSLMLKLHEQGISGESQPVNLWLVEEAAVPREPATPRKGLNLILGLILGLTGGIGLAFFLDYLDNRITDPEETELVLDSPVLSVIPLFPAGNARQIEEVVLRHPLSAFAENYKSLRSALLPAPESRECCKILISSSVMGEGKTTTAVNLATALAQTEKRVVLIDGDLRKPRIHKVFATPNEAGLSTFLAGAGAQHLLQPGPLPNLSLITAGPCPPNPSELLSSQRLPELLDQLATRFDFIICDSPPVLMVTDATILGRYFDGTILVSKAHQTTHEMANRAIKILRDRKLRTLGLVINGIDPRRNEYYYGEYHSASRGGKMVPSRAMLVGSVSGDGD